MESGFFCYDTYYDDDQRHLLASKEGVFFYYLCKFLLGELLFLFI